MTRLAWPLAFLLLAGCAVPVTRPPVAEPARVWQARQAQLLPLNDWDMRGRVALRSATDGGQASLHWTHRPDSQRIELRGPLGSGLVRLQQDATGATLTDNSQHVYRAGNAENLLFDTTGWHIPLDGLAYWIRGLPVPGVPLKQELDDQGRLAVLWQSGWEVRFQSYTRHGAHDLPSRMTLILAQPETSLTQPGVQTGHLPGGDYPIEARLIIERWTLLQ